MPLGRVFSGRARPGSLPWEFLAWGQSQSLEGRAGDTPANPGLPWSASEDGSHPHGKGQPAQGAVCHHHFETLQLTETECRSASPPGGKVGLGLCSSGAPGCPVG